MFIWVIPPIRQYRKQLFLFFLILALPDPINLLFLYLLKINTTFFLFPSACYLLIVSLLKRSTIIKNWILIIVIWILVLTLNLLSKNNSIFLSTVIIFNLITVLILLKNFIVTYVDNRKMNLFLVVIIFYFCTSILKFFNILIGFADATAFFIITSIAQIIFGLFFSIFREDDPRLMV